MTAPGVALSLLSRTPLFAGVAPADLEPLLADFRLRRYATDSYIFREGDPGDHLYVVARGEVKISRTTEAGGEVIFAVLGTGDCGDNHCVAVGVGDAGKEIGGRERKLLIDGGECAGQSAAGGGVIGELEFGIGSVSELEGFDAGDDVAAVRTGCADILDTDQAAVETEDGVVGAIARVDGDVLIGAAVEGVVPRAAHEGVAASFAGEVVGATEAFDQVVAGPAPDMVGGLRSRQMVGERRAGDVLEIDQEQSDVGRSGRQVDGNRRRGIDDRDGVVAGGGIDGGWCDDCLLSVVKK